MSSHNNNDDQMDAQLSRILRNWADHKLPQSQNRVQFLQKIARRELALKNSILPLHSWNSRIILYHPGVFHNAISSELIRFHITGSLFHPFFDC